ncbi:hypothetical protein [Shewanella sp. ENK2]|uniref:hypothetical protein n=1 Tax=Shewanella sp. ENK2 TaxID=2775245 RepID=UPI00374A13CC
MRFAILSLLFVSSLSYSGSFIPLLDTFVVDSKEIIAAEKPTFVVKTIQRGTDDGNSYSTSDAGILTLKLQNMPAKKQGYKFEVSEGYFEDSLFTGEVVTPSEYVENKKDFSFIWFDGNSYEQEAFNIKVKIIGVSASGAESEPQFLTVKHDGIKKPWWRIW